MLAAPLALASVLVVVTVCMHLAGLAMLIRLMRPPARYLQPMASFWRQIGLILLIVLGLFLIHTAQIWTYAVVFHVLGEFETFETALYYSTASFTTAGYGDVVLSDRWRLVGAIESANGFLLLGWSTAFLISVVSRMRTIEFEWVEQKQAGEEAAPPSNPLSHD